MIRQVRMKNFMGVEDSGWIPLGPVTLIYGQNAAGKSTLIKAIQFALQTLARDPLGSVPVFNGPRVNLKSFKNTIFQHDESRDLEVGLKFEAGQPGQEISATIELTYRKLDGYGVHVAGGTLSTHLPRQSAISFARASARGNGAEIKTPEREMESIAARWEIAEAGGSPWLASGTLGTDLNEVRPVYLIEFDECDRFSQEVFSRLELHHLAEEADDESPDFDAHLESNRSNIRRGWSARALEPVVWFVPPATHQAASTGVPEYFRIGDKEKGFDAIVSESAWIRLGTSPLSVPVVLPRAPSPADDGSGPYTELTNSLRGWIHSAVGVIGMHTSSNVQSLGPHRERSLLALREGDDSSWASEDRDPSGLDELRRSTEFRNLVNDWLRDRLGLGFEVAWSVRNDLITGESKSLCLKDLARNTLVEVSAVGYGVGQVVPVVAEILALTRSSASRPALLTVEQPEIHLHPRAQCELGDLIAWFAGIAIPSTADGDADDEIQQHGAVGGQVLLESHSEHIVLRISRRLREAFAAHVDAATPRLSSDEEYDQRTSTVELVSIVYVDRRDCRTVYSTIALQRGGDFADRWPRGFFDERREEIYGR